MADTSSSIAFNDAAPADERFDAQSELQKAHMPRALSDLLPAESIQPVIDFINRDLEDQEFSKALQKPNIIPFPSTAAKNKLPGMQSVWLDDLQVAVMGDYREKPGIFGFDSMRMMVDQTPILSSVILTRIRQIRRFCRPQESGKGMGFEIRLRDRDAKIGPEEKQSIQLLQQFMSNCGWESRPRARMRLRRDDFAHFMAKLVRDSLTLDSAAIETEWKRDKSLGLDGMYAVDGATIRLCTEEGFKSDDEIYALQVVQGNIRAAYTWDDLIYVPRNPRTDVTVAGYGMSETELLIRVVTGFLNAFSYNTRYFDQNAIPKGVLHLTGNYSEQDLNAFKRYWNAMVKGVNNQWTLPLMVSKDQESKAAFEKFGVDVDEMMFSKWMTFLASIICAIYGIAPDEINFESFSASKSSLSGSDTAERLADSKDKGLRPLLGYFEDIFSDYIVQEFSDKYLFRWTGLDSEDEDKRFEMRKLVLSVNEIRAQEGFEACKESWGEAPVNPALIGAWQAEQQQQNQDFGQPGDQQAPGQDGGAPQQPGAAGGQDFGEADGQDAGGGDFGQDNDGADDGTGGQGADTGEPASADDVAKAFGLPVFNIEA